MSELRAKTAAAALPTPGVVFGAYPERRSTAGVGFEPRHAGLPAFLRKFPVGRFNRCVKQAMRRSQEISSLPEAEISRLALRLRAQISRDGLADHLIVQALGLVACVSRRVLGINPFESQLLAARIMLDNRLAEMATGEGKTLAAGMCAATAALAGIPVHVMTSNDYLVVRDAEWLRPLYSALDLRVDFITQPMTMDQRRIAYRADVTYCTAKELVFDYLRDTMVRRVAQSDLHIRIGRMASQASSRRELVMQGLCMAIVDEADSILIDEARVPLILSAVTVVMAAGSLSTAQVVAAQSGYWSIFPKWYVLTPWGLAGFILFMIAATAESNRSPFDLPEGESEIVAGYYIEYSGFKFALFFLGEYIGLFAVSGLGITLFLGGWHAPLACLEWIPSWIWFFAKLLALIAVFIWVRGTLPRLRIDQLMGFAWKLMLPMTLVNILAAGVWRFMPAGIVRWVVCAILVFASYLMLGGALGGRHRLGKRTYRYAE